MTHSAQHNKSGWKKRIANILFLNRYIKKAAAVQFLTKGEYENSIGYNNLTNLILPNGFNDPGKYKNNFSKDDIKATFIGRLDMHHKGLDLLLNVLRRNKGVLEKNISTYLFTDQRGTITIKSKSLLLFWG